MPVAVLTLLAISASWQEARVESGATRVFDLGTVRASQSYRLEVTLIGPIADGDQARLRWREAAGERPLKTLHPGDPDLYLAIRPEVDGPGSIVVEAGDRPITVRASCLIQAVDEGDREAFESEPNDSWRSANPIRLGRAVYGSADDVDYLENLEEGRLGIDWFRFEVGEGSPVLAYFQLEVLDRDVSSNLRVHRLDPGTGQVQPYVEGRDPMEVVHDRERERYSTHLSRTLTRGTYFVEVNANHPDYILRTKVYPVPPMIGPDQAVEAGLDYLLQVGDAWFAQIPREGNIYNRSANLHDTATRCTACHASSFPTEAALVAHRAGYPIQAKASMQTLMTRIANSPTPLYGGDGLNWQRFIAIPLQAQGKQGGILLDFERQVLGRSTPEFERFGPFLKAAWLGRRVMPADESNGVVPLDSKFGLAWRDWRVLTEMTARTGQVRYAQAADTIADILGDPATDRSVETLQDRIHRLHAWNLIDPTGFAPRIKLETEALLARQNPDGGWHELDRKPGPSADYTTGQMTWTLLRMGFSREDPRIARALGYLLARQQPFGGWFQSTTHENFRTPMRETRYAVEALAEAYPRPGGPLRSWGNRDGQAARTPRSDSILNTLDDLENLWDVPAAHRTAMARSLLPFLDHSEPLVRARAAAALGRLGDPIAVDPLIRRLSDPGKIVWRAAAWALRTLGNQGIGLEAIDRALESPDPATRRGAVRIFACQFSGMDQRSGIADRLIRLTDDPDLWTRLQALRTLRQWFYRTPDDQLKRRIVDAYLARMAVPDLPVVRKALSEGMYILLDENLGGGVSLQKNLAALPERYRVNAIQGRQAVERDVLLGPILAALESGTNLQREALIRSFDGSFFRGRTFARQPTGMIDVGNDREFGFLYEPPIDLLDRTFAILLQPGATPEVRRGAIRLASFFLVPERSNDPKIQVALLKGLSDPDPGVVEASRSAIASGLNLRGAEDDPVRLELIQSAILGPDLDGRAIARALGRNPAVLARPEILAAVRARMTRGDLGSILPVLGHPSFSDLEVLAAARSAWAGTVDPLDRMAILDLILARPSVVDKEIPSVEVVELLRLAMADRSSSVRERTLTSLSELTRFRSGKAANSLLLSALADDASSIRKQALILTTPRAEFWTRPDASERLLALLIDSDARVRELALTTVERHRLASTSSRIARRVKAVALEPESKVRAEAILRAEGLDPSILKPDVPRRRLRLLNLSRFRTEVEPLFYQPSADGYSCVQCHANHSVFRIAEGPPSSDRLMINYASALKVVNLGDPESSLLIRKPRSDRGQGGPESSSPTGLAHQGGIRWESADHPAYRTLLSWIGEASAEATSSGPSPLQASADQHAPDAEPARVLDGDPSTFWETESVGANPGYPHELVLDLGSARRVEGLVYVPRQDSSKGRVKDYEVWLSDDGQSWSGPVTRGTWPDDPAFRLVGWLSPRPTRFVKLRGLSAVDGQAGMSMAELAVDFGPD